MRKAFQILAIFFLTAGSMLYMFGQPKLQRELSQWEASPLWQGEDYTKEKPFSFEGKVLPKNKILVLNLVLANREEFTGTGKYNGWKSVEEFRQPLLVGSKNQDTLQVQINELLERGNELTIVPTEERTKRDMHIRYKGLKVGTTISVLGSFTEVHRTPTLTADYVFAGSREQHLGVLRAGKGILQTICISLVGVGLLFLILFFLKKKKVNN